MVGKSVNKLYDTPRKLTWNLKKADLKRKNISKPSILGSCFRVRQQDAEKTAQSQAGCRLRRLTGSSALILTLVQSYEVLSLWNARSSLLRIDW